MTHALSSGQSDSYLFDRIVEYWSQAQRNHVRMMIMAKGESAHQQILNLYQREATLSDMLPPGRILYLGSFPDIKAKEIWTERTHDRLGWSSTRSRLGGSEAALLIDATEGVDPDAVAASFGMIQGGGLIFCFLPHNPPDLGTLKDKLTVWPKGREEVGTRLWKRIWNSFTHPEEFDAISENIWVSRVKQSEVVDDSDLNLSDLDLSEGNEMINDSVTSMIDTLSLSREQAQAIRQILYSHQRQAFTAVALSAERGRGKSSALGLAAAALLSTGSRDVAVTAPNLYAVETLFERAEEALQYLALSPQLKGGDLLCSLGQIRFVSPRALWTREERPDLLLIDEAAALPVPLLERLLERRPSLVFATTTYGYEGTGRGFSLRFRPILQRKLRKLYEPRLTEPLRWSKHDPAERWLMDTLLLNVDLAMKQRAPSLDHYQHRLITADELSADLDLLREIFALLVHAHYRTQPSDLWRILDAPNLTLHVLEYVSTAQEAHEQRSIPRILSAAIISAEGQLPSELAAQVFEGRVRPRGQLFAANFAVHLNREEAASLSLHRVVRIATLPSEHGQGAGSYLLEAITGWSATQGADLIGSSFGVTEQLVRFWLRARYTPLRLGVRQSHVSGERSLLVARGISEQGQVLVKELVHEMDEEWGELLRGSLSTLDPRLVYTLSSWLADVHSTQDDQVLLSSKQWQALAAVAFAGRAYELAALPARHLALHWLKHLPLRLDQSAPLAPLGRLIITKVLQGQRWMEVTADLQLHSPSETMKGLSTALRLLYRQYAPNWALEKASRFPYFHREAQLSSKLLPAQVLTLSGDTSSPIR